jgi:hypothetical protein
MVGRATCVWSPPAIKQQSILMSASGGALNWSTQQFILNAKMECLMIGQRYCRGFTATGKTEFWDRWQRGESLKAIGRAFGKPSSSIYFSSSPARWDSSCIAASLAVGLDVLGARGDLEGHSGASVGAIDGPVARPLALDGEPRNQSQWRLSSIPSGGG